MERRNSWHFGLGLFGALLALSLLFSAQCVMAHPDHGQPLAPQAPVMSPHDHHHPQPNDTAPAKPDCCDEDTIDCCKELKATPHQAQLKPEQGPSLALNQVSVVLGPSLSWQPYDARLRVAPPGPLATPVSLKQVQLN